VSKTVYPYPDMTLPNPEGIITPSQTGASGIFILG